MSNCKDVTGFAVAYGGGFDASAFHNSFAVFQVEVDHSQLSGASTKIDLTGFPTRARIWDHQVEVKEVFAGEADVAVFAGDTADADELFASANLNAVAVGELAVTDGAAMTSRPRIEADYDTAGAGLTFSATELGDLTAGKLIYRVFYTRLPLSTDTP